MSSMLYGIYGRPMESAVKVSQRRPALDLPLCIAINVKAAGKIDCLKEVLQSSFETGTDYVPNPNGFVKTVIEAYNQHLHLVIR